MNPAILVVDDSPTARNVLKTHLAGIQLACVEAEDAARALQLLHQQPITLVIADINMPGMDGIAFVQELRAQALPHLRDLPVILITGEKGSELRERGLAAGANAFLQKPVTPENLRDTVRAWLPNR